MQGLEQFTIWEEGFGNVVDGGEITGFRLKLSLPFYRALPLSCIEEIRLKMDEETVDSRNISLQIQGRRLSIEDLPPEYEDLWWNVDKKADLIVSRPGGLTAGEHVVEVFLKLRWEFLKPTSWGGLEQSAMFDDTTAVKTLAIE